MQGLSGGIGGIDGYQDLGRLGSRDLVDSRCRWAARMIIPRAAQSLACVVEHLMPHDEFYSHASPRELACEKVKG